MITEKDLIECRKTQIRLLDALKEICDRHGLVYWIDFGTLLGAVRTGGFIPWDDDADVSMPMKDYRRFLEIAGKELPRDIFLQTPKTDPGYKQCFTKLRDCYSTFMEHHESDATKYHKGIYIDIFPSYYYPKTPYLFRKVLLYFTGRSRSNAVITRKNVIANYLIYAACKTVWFILSPLKSNRLGQTPEDNWYYYAIPDTLVYPLKDMPFEGKPYAAPSKAHEYLSLMYGPKYMVPPPLEKRIPHAKLILPNTPCDHPRALRRAHG